MQKTEASKIRRTLKTAALITVLVSAAAFIASCASTASPGAGEKSAASEQAPAAAQKTGLRIPFTLDSHHHVILTFKTDEGIPVRLNFDSGCPDKKGTVTAEGFRKLTGSDYENALKIRRKYFDEHFTALTGKNRADCGEAEIERLYEIHSKKISTDFAPGYLRNGNIICSNYPEAKKALKATVQFPLIDFTYCPAETEDYEDSGTDGTDGADATVGFSFFEGAKRICFNYKENFIEIDGAGIGGQEIPMYFFNATGHWFAPVTIDGKADYALLDTGSEVFTLREAAFSREQLCRMMEDKNLRFVDYFNVLRKASLPVTDGEYNTAKSFTIGDVTWENVRALKITDRHIHTGGISRLIIASSNNIGYPFFKDKVIQFDLEKMVFRIEE